MPFEEVKDTRWLSQEKAIANLQRNLPAVLANLAEEADTQKDPMARWLYTYCATYRFVAAVLIQADILPHLTQLSKLFQKEDLNFLAISEHVSYCIFNNPLVVLTLKLLIYIRFTHKVPVTIETLRQIKEAGKQQVPGSFLAQLNERVNLLNIDTAEERMSRRKVRTSTTGTVSRSK